MPVKENELDQVRKLSKDKIFEILRMYIKEGISQKNINEKMDFASDDWLTSSVIRAYNFNFDSSKKGQHRGVYRGVPDEYIKEFAYAYYPGFLNMSITFDEFIKKQKVKEATQRKPSPPKPSPKSSPQPQFAKGTSEPYKAPYSHPNSSSHSQPRNYTNTNSDNDSTSFIGMLIIICFVIFLASKLFSNIVPGFGDVTEKITNAIPFFDAPTVEQLSLEDGDYAGELTKEKADGLGRLQFNEDTYYIGRFEKNEKAVSGVIMHDDSVDYIGNFSDDRFHGLGGYKIDNDSMYAGEFKKGKQHGIGAIYTPNDSIVIGKYRKGKLKKELASINLEQHTVDVYDNKRFMQNYLDDTTYAVSEGKGDQIDGMTVRVSEDGVFFGYYEKGKRKGFGLFIHNMGQIEFGDMQKSKLNDAVVIHDKSVAIGVYKNSVRTGKGLEYSIDESSFYIGKFKKGVPKGKGIYYHSNNTSEEVKF